jgi:hypothetical protein
VPGRHHSRGAVEQRTEVVAVAQLRLTRRQAHPNRQLKCPLRSHRGFDRGLGEVNTATTRSPVWLNK